MHRNAPLSPMKEGARVHYSYGSYAPSTYGSYGPRKANLSTDLFNAAGPQVDVHFAGEGPAGLRARWGAAARDHSMVPGKIHVASLAQFSPLHTLSTDETVAKTVRTARDCVVTVARILFAEFILFGQNNYRGHGVERWGMEQSPR